MADLNVSLCHGYGCKTRVDIRYAETRLAGLARRLAATKSAEEERDVLSLVLGDLYRWAGEQSVIRNDRGGNYADEGVEGAMDCIDHSTSTTRLLRALEARGYLHWHRVLEPDVRRPFSVLGVHYSAVIETLDDEERFVVDTWFVDNGKPAVILPLEDWKRGAGPNV